MNPFKSFCAASVLSVAAIVTVGCESRTEGERTLDKARQVEDAGQMILRGEKMVADGKAEVTRGETIRDQGDRIEGERIIAQGRAQQRQGEALIAEGRKLRN